MLFCVVLYGIARYCKALYDIVRYIVLYCKVLQGIFKVYWKVS